MTKYKHNPYVMHAIWDMTKVPKHKEEVEETVFDEFKPASVPLYEIMKLLNQGQKPLMLADNIWDQYLILATNLTYYNKKTLNYQNQWLEDIQNLKNDPSEYEMEEYYKKYRDSYFSYRHVLNTFNDYIKKYDLNPKFITDINDHYMLRRIIDYGY